MQHSKVECFVHLVWTTRHREPLLAPEAERIIHHCIQGEAQRLGCKVLALNGMPDHVHLVVQLPSTLAIARLAQAVKGVSSLYTNQKLGFDGAFDWQQNYAAFSLSRSHLARVVRYVERQKEHHLANRVWAEWEETYAGS